MVARPPRNNASPTVAGSAAPTRNVSIMLTTTAGPYASSFLIAVITTVTSSSSLVH